MPACVADPAIRLARYADLSDFVICLQGYEPRRGASQSGMRRPCLFAHFQSDQRSAGGRRGRDRDRQRTGYDASWSGNHRRGRLAYRGIARVVWQIAQSAVLQVEAIPH